MTANDVLKPCNCTKLQMYYFPLFTTQLEPIFYLGRIDIFNMLTQNVLPTWLLCWI